MTSMSRRTTSRRRAGGRNESNRFLTLMIIESTQAQTHTHTHASTHSLLIRHTHVDISRGKNWTTALLAADRPALAGRHKERQPLRTSGHQQAAGDRVVEQRLCAREFHAPSNSVRWSLYEPDGLETQSLVSTMVDLLTALALNFVRKPSSTFTIFGRTTNSGASREYGQHLKESSRQPIRPHRNGV